MSRERETRQRCAKFQINAMWNRLNMHGLCSNIDDNNNSSSSATNEEKEN